MICENCGSEYDVGYSTRFCSLKCVKSFSTKNDNTQQKKAAKCIICGKDIFINKRASISKCKCNDCQNLTFKKCKICGHIFIGTKNQQVCSDICKNISKQKIALTHFGFNNATIGTQDVFNEYNNIKNILYKLYWIENKSFNDIAVIFNYKQNPGNLTKIFKYLNINRRTFSESNINAYLTGKVNSLTHNQYKCGWHTTWNNKKVFLRSSYELDYAQKLDRQHIDYDVECLRIKYFNTRLNSYHCAIPDFYIPTLNMIVEIKSDWTLDIQEMRDKMKAYKDLGYNFKLICNHNEMVL